MKDEANHSVNKSKPEESSHDETESEELDLESPSRRWLRNLKGHSAWQACRPPSSKGDTGSCQAPVSRHRGRGRRSRCSSRAVLDTNQR